MSTSTTPTRSLYLRWKALRLPWRRHILVGSDLSGNTFWEYFPRGVSRAVRPRRILRPYKKTHHSDVQVSPQWHQWLKATRADAPSMQEQIQDLQRIQELQVNARLADARWEAKARYIEKPKGSEAEVSAQKRTFGAVDEAKSDGTAAVRGEMPQPELDGIEGVRTAVDTQIPKGTPNPWKKVDETGHNPGGKWQPEAWSPEPKRLFATALVDVEEDARGRKIIKVEKEGEDLYVCKGSCSLTEALFPFLIDTIGNDEDKKMLLAWYACSDAVGNMHKLIKDLLHDIAVEIVCVSVRPLNVRRNVVFHLNSGVEHAIASGNSHAVFRVKLKYGAGTFCLDLTGSQYWHCDEPVMLWEKYHAERFDIMNEPQAGGVVEKGYEEFGNGTPLVRDRQWRVVRTHLSMMKTFCAAYEAFKLGNGEASTAPVSAQIAGRATKP